MASKIQRWRVFGYFLACFGLTTCKIKGVGNGVGVIGGNGARTWRRPMVVAIAIDTTTGNRALVWNAMAGSCRLKSTLHGARPLASTQLRTPPAPTPLAGVGATRRPAWCSGDEPLSNPTSGVGATRSRGWRSGDEPRSTPASGVGATRRPAWRSGHEPRSTPASGVGATHVASTSVLRGEPGWRGAVVIYRAVRPRRMGTANRCVASGGFGVRFTVTKRV